VFESGEGKKASRTEEVSDWRDSKDVQFSLLSNQFGIHQNGITQVLIVQQENLFFTIGQD